MDLLNWNKFHIRSWPALSRAARSPAAKVEG